MREKNQLRYVFFRYGLYIHVFTSIGIALILNFVTETSIYEYPWNIINSLIFTLIPLFCLSTLNEVNMEKVAHFYLSFMWIYATISVLLIGGFSNPTFLMGFLLIYAAQIVLDSRGLWIYSALTMISLILIVINTEFQIFKTKPLNADQSEINYNLALYGGIVTLILFFTSFKSFGIIKNGIKNQNENKLLMEELVLTNKQFEFSQKMTTVSTMAGGIAHQYNNILTGIMGYIELLSYENEFTLKEKFLNEIIGGSRQASRLSQQLLSFTKVKDFNPSLSDVNRIIANRINFVSSILNERIRVKYELSNNLPKILIDKSSFEQSYYQLLLNASQSMANQGKIVVSTRIKEILINEGNSEIYLVVSVKDFGEGIDPAIRERMFDPFVTTKNSSLGLGLTLVSNFIERSRGKIEIESTSEFGTNVQILLPLNKSLK